MSNGFVHSVKVPRLYKTAASIVRNVREDGGSLKTLIYQKQHPNVSGIYALTVNTLQRAEELDYLLRKTHILINESRLDPWLARVLITELIWGKQSLKTDCKPVKTVLCYEKQLREELKNINNSEESQPSRNTVRKPRYVRINTLQLPIENAKSSFQDEGWRLLPKCSSYSSYLETIKSLTDWDFIQDFHIPELLVFPPIPFHSHVLYQNGGIILQDKASCLPAYLLNPEPGSVILEMCAAPGMKTSHLAAIMENQGKIYAIEKDERRFEALCEQVKKTDCICVKPIHSDALKIDPKQCSDVDYILVDPSCSGSGMTDRQLIDGQNKIPASRLKGLQAFQVFLLRHALLNFPTAKKVVYSTCSIHSEENEEVVDEALSDVQGAYDLVPINDFFRKDWMNYSSANFNCSNKCLYAKPEVDQCNGFFVAIFERNFDIPLPEYNGRADVLKRFQRNDESTTDTAENKSSRKRKKRGKRKQKIDDNPGEPESVQVDEENVEATLKATTDAEETIVPDSENEPRRKKRKKKKSKDNDDDVEKEETEANHNVGVEENLSNTTAPSDSDRVMKKKKKKKRKEEDDSIVVE